MMNDYKSYLAFLMAGNRGKCYEILIKRIESGDDIIDIYTHFIQMSLYEIGELWQKNKISVAVEHMATAITESLLSYLYPHFVKKTKNGKKAVICGITSERHQLGSRLVADYMDILGWHTSFLGSNVPVNDLMNFIEINNPDIICLSVTMYYNIIHLRTCLEEINSNYPETPVIVGGQAFHWGGYGVVNDFSNVSVVYSLMELKQQLSEYASVS